MTDPEKPREGNRETRSPTQKRPAWRNWGDHPAVVVATIMASVAAIFSAYLQVRDRAPSGSATPPQAESQVNGRPAPETKAAECVDVTGRWRWHTTGGVVSIAKNGTIEWYRLPSDPSPLINGTWECDPKVNPRHFTFRWFQTNFVDTLVLSTSGQNMRGATTNNGFRLSGSRLR